MYSQKFVDNAYTQKLHDDNLFPEYGIVSNPFDSIIKCDFNRIQYHDRDYYASHNNPYIVEWKDKKPFFIIFNNFPNDSFELDVLSYTDGCNVYCLDTINKKVISFKEMFYKYYGSLDKYNYVDKKEKELKKYLDSNCNNKENMRRLYEVFDSLNFMKPYNISVDRFEYIIKNIINLDSNEMSALKLQYIMHHFNIPHLYVTYEQRNQRVNEIEQMIQYTLSPVHYSDYLQNTMLIRLKRRNIDEKLFFTK